MDSYLILSALSLGVLVNVCEHEFDYADKSTERQEVMQVAIERCATIPVMFDVVRQHP